MDNGWSPFPPRAPPCPTPRPRARLVCVCGLVPRRAGAVGELDGREGPAGLQLVRLQRGLSVVGSGHGAEGREGLPPGG